MDQLTEIVYKLALRSPAVAATVVKQTDLYKAIDKFHKDFPTLPVGQSGKIRIFKEGSTLRWNDINNNFLNKSKIEWIQTYMKSRQEKLWTHLKKSAQEQQRISDSIAVPSKASDPNQYFDSDDEMYYQVFRQGDKVDFYSNGTWYEGVVEIALEEMLKCSTLADSPTKTWVAVESDDYSRYGQVKNNKREMLHNFYDQLS